MDRKNFVQTADKQTKEIKLLLKALFTKYLMDYLILMQNSGKPLFLF